MKKIMITSCLIILLTLFSIPENALAKTNQVQKDATITFYFSSKSNQTVSLKKVYLVKNHDSNSVSKKATDSLPQLNLNDNLWLSLSGLFLVGILLLVVSLRRKEV